MKEYEMFVFGLFGTGLGIVIGVVHKDMNIAFMMFGTAFLIAIAPKMKKELHRITAPN